MTKVRSILKKCSAQCGKDFNDSILNNATGMDPSSKQKDPQLAQLVLLAPISYPSDLDLRTAPNSLMPSATSVASQVSRQLISYQCNNMDLASLLKIIVFSLKRFKRVLRRYLSNNVPQYFSAIVLHANLQSFNQSLFDNSRCGLVKMFGKCSALHRIEWNTLLRHLYSLLHELNKFINELSVRNIVWNLTKHADSDWNCADCDQPRHLYTLLQHMQKPYILNDCYFLYIYLAVLNAFLLQIITFDACRQICYQIEKYFFYETAHRNFLIPAIKHPSATPPKNPSPTLSNDPSFDLLQNPSSIQSKNPSRTESKEKLENNCNSPPIKRVKLVNKKRTNRLRNRYR